MPSNSKRTVAFPLGKEMWKKELSDHQKRLQTVKTTLVPLAPVAPPSSRGGLGSSRGNPRSGTVSQRIGSPLKLHGALAAANSGAAAPASAADAAPSGIDAAPTLKIEQLPAADQQTCHAVIEMLRRLSTAQSKAVLEEVFVASEMRRLLSHYTGVYADDLTQVAATPATKKRGSGSTTSGPDHKGEAPSPTSPQGQKATKKPTTASQSAATPASTESSKMSSSQAEPLVAPTRDTKQSKESVEVAKAGGGAPAAASPSHRTSSHSKTSVEEASLEVSSPQRHESSVADASPSPTSKANDEYAEEAFE